MRVLEDNGVLYEERGPVMWRCEGCGFRLDLPEGVAPPMWHTLDRPMETPPDEIPDCPNINWIKLGERETVKSAAPRGHDAAHMISRNEYPQRRDLGAFGRKITPTDTSQWPLE